MDGTARGASLLATRADKTHSAGLVQQLQDRVSRLQQQVANYLATRREVDDVKATSIASKTNWIRS